MASFLALTTRTAGVTGAWILLINVRMNLLKSSTYGMSAARIGAGTDVGPKIGVSRPTDVRFGARRLMTGLLCQMRGILEG